jgi:NitT/TauT family transport system substrate-binding protein
MKLLRVRLARLLVPFVFVVVLLGACAPATQSATAPTAPTAPTAAAGAAAAAAPTSAPAPTVAVAAAGASTSAPTGVAATKPAAAAATTAPAAAAGAAQATPGPVATRPATNPTDTIHIVFGGAVTPPNMVHLAPYIAKDLGFFDEVGLDVEMKSFEGGVSALRGGMSGGLDVVATSSDPLFAAIQQGAPVKAIGTYAPKLSVVLMGVPDLKAAADLKGKKLGIQGVGGFAGGMSRRVLAGAGI